MQQRNFLTFLAGSTLVLSACTSDLPAPNNYEPTSVSDSAGGNVMLDCEEIPGTAVGADFSYMPVITGGEGETLSFTIDPLPPGLIFDATTGVLSGTPTEAAAFTFNVSVTGSEGAVGMTECTLDVNPPVAVDIEPLAVAAPFCVRPGMGTLRDFIVPGTGDGTEPLCFHDGGNGDGSLPAGISVNQDTCEVEGSIEESRYGTWAFIVRGDQNGASVHVPYCVTQDARTGYEVTVDHSGLGANNVDGTLIPIMRRFNPGAAIDFGGGMDPVFTITDDDSCGANACFFGFAFNINASQFDADTLDLRPTGLVPEGGPPMGFFHNLSIRRPGPVDDGFGDRPWTVNIGMDYCIANNEGDPMDETDGPCEEAPNIRANGEGEFMVSLLMYPS